MQEEVANLTYKKNPTQALDVLKYLGDPGFGELGAMDNRPSGIYLGFLYLLISAFLHKKRPSVVQIISVLPLANVQGAFF